MNGDHYHVVLTGEQLSALTAACDTCENVWDGDDDQALEEQANLAAARVALNQAERIG